MSAIHRILNQFHAHLQLGRIPFVSFIYQSRITADLPQPRDLCKDLQFRSVKLRIRLHPKHQAEPFRMGLIQLLLLTFQRGKHIFFQLIRQILQHIPLQSPQHKRTDHFLQTLHRIGIAVLHSRKLYFLAEFLIRIQKSRHQKIKNTPQLTEPVLYRCTGQRKPEFRPDLLHSLCHLSSVILDILCLINDLHGKIQILISLQIPFQKVIGGDQNLPFSRIFDQCLPLLHITSYNGSRKSRRKTFNLVHPVKHKRSRRYHKGTSVFSRRGFLKF